MQTRAQVIHRVMHPWGELQRCDSKYFGDNSWLLPPRRHQEPDEYEPKTNEDIRLPELRNRQCE